MLWFFKIFSPKNLAFFAQTTASFCKNFNHNIGFEKNANFFAENYQKSQKIVTPGFHCILLPQT
jgi:hypothetical protein